LSQRQHSVQTADLLQLASAVNTLTQASQSPYTTKHGTIHKGFHNQQAVINR